MKRSLPAFSVILSFVVLSIVGILSLPGLNIQYEPSVHEKSMSVSWSWEGASPFIMEREVTSVIEGLVASLDNVQKINSYSGKGRGYVSFELKKHADPEMVRFELSSMLRRYADKLPDGVSMPQISGSAMGTQNRPIMTYTIIADLPSYMIAMFAEEHIVPEISRMEGVRNVSVTGVNRYQQTLVFDPDKLSALGLTVNDISSVVNAALEDDRIAGTLDGTGVHLTMKADVSSLMSLPVRRIQDRIYYLSDVAQMRFEEKEPDSYFRINGKNTVNLTVYAGEEVNVLRLADNIRQTVQAMSVSFPETYTLDLVRDDSKELRSELRKIYIRTGLSLLILLLFVLITSRSFRYLLVIASALTANLLIAVFFYAVLGVTVQIYSLAGITVSFGIMIDASIIMVSHYCYYRNRKAFHSILAAQLTTIGALSVVFLLPEALKARLSDFAAVIIINLAISLLISVLFIPALSDTVGLKNAISSPSFKRRRRTVRFNGWYERYILKGRRWSWATVLLLVLAFGLPVSKLPDSAGKEPFGFWERTYNSTLGSEFFKNRLKDPLNKVLGGSMWLFSERGRAEYRGGSNTAITIRAMLPDGCTVSQMNEVIADMEAYLSGYLGQVESFETSISSASDASITVKFPEDVEVTSFPMLLKSKIISKAIQLGGASWSVYGVDNNPFSNHVSYGYKSESFSISGYNLDRLYEYAGASIEHLSSNPRVKAPVISARQWYTGTISEIFMDFDAGRLADMGFSPQYVFGKIGTMLYSGTAGSYYDDMGYKIPVVLESSRKNDYETWGMENEYISGDDGTFKFGSFGTISKREAASSIYKTDQQYTLTVAYEFVGNHKLASKVQKDEIARLNKTVLPVGYKAYSASGWWFSEAETAKVVGLLLLVVAIIFFITGVMFESLRIPFAVIGLIPVAFTGVFLTFALLRIPFNMGCMAAMVMLSGLVVNASFYLLNEYRGQISRPGMTPVRAYIRAFNHKIVPILLTLLSTFLGLLPFLMDGKDDEFWFSFATGTMSGLLFSIPAIIFLFPLWIKFASNNNL